MIKIISYYTKSPSNWNEGSEKIMCYRDGECIGELDEIEVLAAPEGKEAIGYLTMSTPIKNPELPFEIIVSKDGLIYDIKNYYINVQIYSHIEYNKLDTKMLFKSETMIIDKKPYSSINCDSIISDSDIDPNYTISQSPYDIDILINDLAERSRDAIDNTRLNNNDNTNTFRSRMPYATLSSIETEELPNDYESGNIELNLNTNTPNITQETGGIHYEITFDNGSTIMLNNNEFNEFMHECNLTRTGFSTWGRTDISTQESDTASGLNINSEGITLNFNNRRSNRYGEENNGN